MAKLDDNYPKRMSLVQHTEFVNRFGRRVGNEIGSMDAFGRLRVSQPTNRFDAHFTYDLQPLLFEQLTNGNGAAISHDDTNRAASLALSDTPNGGYAYMQSYEWTYYQAGNSHQILASFNFQGHTPNVTKFVGYGDRVNNGIHFISNGVSPAWRLLSNTDKGDETVLQADWNEDTLDGSGNNNNPSGTKLDITKIQIAVIDLQALYSGRVRVGFDIGGVIVYCHEFNHANAIMAPYIQIATLPVIAGMQCSDTATATMLFICSTVRSEGAAIEEEGNNFSAEGSVTAGNGARTHVLSVRPKTTFNSIESRLRFILESIDILVTGNNPVLWEVCFGQALDTPSYTDVNAAHSGFEFVVGATLSGDPALVAVQGYVASSAVNKTSVSRILSSRYPVTLDAAGAVRDLGTMTLLATGLGATSAMRTALNWRELR